PAPGGPPPAPQATTAEKRAARPPDRRLRLEDGLKLMVADGPRTAADAEHLGRSRTKQYDHPLELVAAQKWKSAKPPHKLLTVEYLVEWLPNKTKISFLHTHPPAA